jgi:hypothetical protein
MFQTKTVDFYKVRDKVVPVPLKAPQGGIAQRILSIVTRVM